jgi:heme ABC exporter ATP-binding subunit CcmA
MCASSVPAVESAGPDVQPRPAVVELTDAIAVLGRFPALAGVTLAVRPGEIVLLRGPNGAGKTTLLRLCAGRIPLARGEGAVLGCDLRTDRRHLRPLVGVLGHRNGLYLDLTVSENVQFWASVVGAGAAEVATVLDRLGLSGRLASLPARRLSAGQMRRTAFACFVVRRAHLWLLDEPHTGLDATARDEVDDILRQASSSGVTVILASHELERASALATRTIELSGGVVTADFDARGEAFG